MDKTIHLSFNAADRSYLALLKKEIHNTITKAEFSKKKIGEIDIIIAELTSNLIKHANGGELLARIFSGHKSEGLEIITIDNGPGMKDPARMMQDGISTAQTLGHGLGAIKRLSNEFQIYSLPGWGTIALTRIYKEDTESTQTQPERKYTARSLMVPKPGEKVCGDGFFIKRGTYHIQLLAVDGLGHGPEAYHATQKAIEAFTQCRETSPAEVIRYLHACVKNTRGLVGTVIVIDVKTNTARFCGVGNIATRFYFGLLHKTHVCHNGIIGLNIPHVMHDQELSLENYQHIIMCSDGIRSRWEISKYPMIFKYDLSIVAAAIYKDYGRQNDDMSVTLIKVN